MLDRDRFRCDPALGPPDASSRRLGLPGCSPPLGRVIVGGAVLKSKGRDFSIWSRFDFVGESVACEISRKDVAHAALMIQMIQ